MIRHIVAEEVILQHLNGFMSLAAPRGLWIDKRPFLFATTVK